MSLVAIYNPGGSEVVGYVTVKHAVNMLVRKVAVVLEAVPNRKFGPYEFPSSVELVRFVYRKWLYSSHRPLAYSGKGLLARDRYECAYCGRRANTQDHVVPRCQGGVSEWLNVVAACKPCNSRKGGRTPEQAGMRMRFEPFVPTRADIMGEGGRRRSR